MTIVQTVCILILIVIKTLVLSQIYVLETNPTDSRPDDGLRSDRTTDGEAAEILNEDLGRETVDEGTVVQELIPITVSEDAGVPGSIQSSPEVDGRPVSESGGSEPERAQNRPKIRRQRVLASSDDNDELDDVDSDALERRAYRRRAAQTGYRTPDNRRRPRTKGTRPLRPLRYSTPTGSEEDEAQDEEDPVDGFSEEFLRRRLLANRRSRGLTELRRQLRDRRLGRGPARGRVRPLPAPQPQPQLVQVQVPVRQPTPIGPQVLIRQPQQSAAANYPCSESWSAWSPAAACPPGSCGACQQQTLRRRCLSLPNCPCSGADTKSEQCSDRPCEEPRPSCCADYVATFYQNELSCRKNVAPIEPPRVTLPPPPPPLPLSQPTASNSRSNAEPPCCADLRGTWSSWMFAAARCSDDCGGFGRQPRRRVCLSTEHGCPCIGNSDEIIACNLRPCQFPRQTCAPGLQVQMRIGDERDRLSAICAPPQPSFAGPNNFQAQQELPNIRYFADDETQPPDNEILMADLTNGIGTSSNVKLFMDPSMDSEFRAEPAVEYSFAEGLPNNLEEIVTSSNGVNGIDFSNLDGNMYNVESPPIFTIENDQANAPTIDANDPADVEFAVEDTLNANTLPQLKSDRNQSELIPTNDNSTKNEDILKKDFPGEAIPTQDVEGPVTSELEAESDSDEIRRKRQIFGADSVRDLANGGGQAVPAGLRIPAINTQDFAPVQQDQGANDPVIGIHPGQLEWRRENQIRLLGNTLPSPQTSPLIPINPFADNNGIAESGNTGNGLLSAAPTAPGVQSTRNENQPLFLPIPGQSRVFRDAARGRSTTIVPGILVLRRQLSSGTTSPRDGLLGSQQSENTQPPVPPLQLSDNERISTNNRNAIAGQTPTISAPLTSSIQLPNVPPPVSQSIIQPISTNEISTQPSDFYRVLQQPGVGPFPTGTVYGEPPTEEPLQRYYEIIGQVDDDNNRQYAQAQPGAPIVNKQDDTVSIYNSDGPTQEIVANPVPGNDFIDENGVNTAVEEETRSKRSARFKRQQNVGNIRNRFQQFIQSLRRQFNVQQQGQGSGPGQGSNGTSRNLPTNGLFPRNDENFINTIQSLQNLQNQGLDALRVPNVGRNVLPLGNSNLNNIIRGAGPFSNPNVFNVRGNPNADNTAIPPPTNELFGGLANGSLPNGPRRVPDGSDNNVPPITEEEISVIPPPSDVSNRTNVLMNLNRDSAANVNNRDSNPPSPFQSVGSVPSPLSVLNNRLRQEQQRQALTENRNQLSPASLVALLGSQQSLRQSAFLNQQATGARQPSQLRLPSLFPVDETNLADLQQQLLSQSSIAQPSSRNVNGNFPLNGIPTNGISAIDSGLGRSPLTDPRLSLATQRNGISSIPSGLGNSPLTDPRLSLVAQANGIDQIFGGLSGSSLADPRLSLTSQLNGIGPISEGLSGSPLTDPRLSLAQLQQVQSALAVSRALNGQNRPTADTQASPNIFIINSESAQGPPLQQRRQLQLVQIRPGVYSLVENGNAPSLQRPGSIQTRRPIGQPTSNSLQQGQQPRTPLKQPNCCVVGGIWDLWTEWSTCSADCGGCGRRTRVRQCASQKQGCPCNSAESSQTESCNMTPCSFPRSACCEGLRPRASGQSYICA